MNGWIITDQKADVGEVDFQTNYEGLYFGYKHNGQFTNDKVFFEDNNWIVCLDGVILNKKELIRENDWASTILYLYHASGNFPNILRGSFNGFVFSKTNYKLLIFTNHLGDRPVFYSTISTKVIISSDFNMLVDIYRQNMISRSLCESAVKYMITFGYMIEDCTYIDTIRRLMPGSRASLFIGETIEYELDWYHKFTNRMTVSDDTENIIKNIDFLFRKALSMALDKDIEYGRKSLLDLSGGLDCRVVNYVAKAMGYENIINISFSQVNSDEYKVAMMLNRDLRNDMIFLPLDNANFMKKIDNIVSMNYGLSLYSGATIVSDMIEHLNYQNIGIEHGGLLGEMHDGSMPGNDYFIQQQASFDKGMRFSKIISDNVLDESVLNMYENNEIFTVIGRGLLAGYSTVIIRHNVCEFFSPFGDVDFYDYFLSIPLEKRVKNKILQKWVEECYPEAFQIIYDKTMCRINDNKFTVFPKKFLRKVKSRLMYELNIAKKNNMNPFDYWYNTNPDFKSFIHSYYEENIFKIKDLTDLSKYISELFIKGNVRDKTMALTALSAIKLYIL